MDTKVIRTIGSKKNNKLMNYWKTVLISDLEGQINIHASKLKHIDSEIHEKN